MAAIIFLLEIPYGNASSTKTFLARHGNPRDPSTTRPALAVARAKCRWKGATPGQATGQPKTQSLWTHLEHLFVGILEMPWKSIEVNLGRTRPAGKAPNWDSPSPVGFGTGPDLRHN